jgi:hypothetical protein
LTLGKDQQLFLSANTLSLRKRVEWQSMKQNIVSKSHLCYEIVRNKTSGKIER